MRQYETIDWKHYAQNQQLLRREAEQKLAGLNIAFNKARHMAQQILNYSRKLEAELQQLKMHAQQNRSMLQSQQETSKVLQQNNKQLRAANIELTTKLQNATAQLAAAQKELQFAQQKLQFNDALELLNNTSNPVAINDDLEKFFVYHPKVIHMAEKDAM